MKSTNLSKVSDDVKKRNPHLFKKQPKKQSEKQHVEKRIRKITVPIVPIGKPRMTQSDKWKKRPAVVRYYAFKDELRKAVGELGDVEILSWVAYLPIPKSWTKKKKLEMKGKPHRQKPDRDNIDKAILDALFKDDSGIAGGTIFKYWDDGKGTRLVIIIGPDDKD